MSLGDDESLLRKADLPNTVSSDDPHGSVVELFEIPALKASVSHDRVAGWWDFLWLNQAREGLEDFIEGGHSMRLLIGIPIASSLTNLIRAEEESKSEETANRLLDMMKESPELSQFEIFDLLVWMIKKEHIQIRILLVGHSDRKPAAEHAKIQIYYDGIETVASSGSKNDTRRGNEGGVDFLVVAKSWSSDDSKSQVLGMKNYFDSHWNHKEVVRLEDLKDNKEFMKQLEELAMKHNDKIDPRILFYRKIGKLMKKEGVERLIIDSTSQTYPSDLPQRFEQIDTIRAGEPLHSDHINHIRRYLPEVKTVFVVPDDSNEQFSTDNDQLYRFIFHNGDGVTSDNLEHDGNLDERVLNFFELEQAESVEVNSPPVDPNVSAAGEEILEYARKPSHPLVPDIIKNYKWGTSLRPHHIRALTGQEDSSADDNEKSIETGFLNTKKGLFEHATGSGKTGLGLITAAHMLEQGDINFVVVVAPKISIADQWWLQALELFNFENKDFKDFIPLRSYTDSKGFSGSVDRLYRVSKIAPEEWPNELEGAKNFLITVSNTFFDNIAKLVECENNGLKWGLIVDEAHNLVGSEKTKLPELEQINPEYKLALTAKFQNPRNVKGSQEVLDWLCGEENHTDKFPLSSALKMGYLKPYNFNLNLIDAYDDASMKKQSQKYVLENYGKLEHGPTLLYANEITVHRVDLLVMEFQLRGHNPQQFTYLNQDGSLLPLWSRGVYNPMISLTILDEGVDVPSCSAAILLDCSEVDDRQWIQRRGRTLRVDATNPDAFAIIHDFAPIFSLDNDWSIEWWRRNVGRILEFARDSSESSVPGSDKTVPELCLRITTELG